MMLCNWGVARGCCLATVGCGFDDTDEDDDGDIAMRESLIIIRMAMNDDGDDEDER